VLPLEGKRCFYSCWFLLLTVIILSAGCAGFIHGWTTDEYVGQMLPASIGRGAKRLEIEVNFSPVVRKFVQNRGTPDYIYVVSDKKTHLIYIQKNLLVTFNRRFSVKNTQTTEEPIPNAMLALISKVAPPEKKVERTIGTGFAVGPNGLVLTAYHVVERAIKIKVHLSNRGVFEAHIERSSPSTDLLLLKIDTQFSTYLTPISTHSLSIGERVFTIGYPAISLLGEEPKFTEGSIAALSGPVGDPMLMQISVPVQPGNSGGPLVTERGELVGVVIASADVVKFLTSTGSLPQNVNWAIKADYVRAMLPQSGVANILSSREKAINQTKLSVCMIEVITGP
jgi:S1-C subfamily serine protease